MPLIDGIGDEVVHFCIAVIVIVVAILAWVSTNARPDRYRTVLLMRARGHNPMTVSIRTRQGARIPRTRNTSRRILAVDPTGTRHTQIDSSNHSNSRVIPLQEMDSIVDADMAMMNNNRLHFYRRVEGPTNIRSVEEPGPAEETETMEEHEVEPASNDQIREMDSIVSAMEAELDTDSTASAQIADVADSVTEDNNNTTTPSEINKSEDKDNEVTQENTNDNPSTTNTSEPETSNERKILIKLKYINDTLKEVEGSLDEQLKDFKCRHFSAELSSESRVRLIFNGRVLLDDAATLQACGLHHRAVVHCLVQPKRAGGQSQPQNNAERPGTVHEFVTEMINPERYWDLENILMTLVSLALTIVWFFSWLGCRCEYSNMFTASASVALFGLTVFYSVAIFGLYLSDTFHFERRPAANAAPAPPN